MTDVATGQRVRPGSRFPLGANPAVQPTAVSLLVWLWRRDERL